MKALIIIDMLNDFLSKEGALYCGDTSRKIIPFVKNKIEEFHEKGDLVIFICDAHDEDDREFKMFEKHAVENSNGAEIIEELPIFKDDIIIKKKTFSSFLGTGLDKVLKEYKISEIHLLGVCTSICIMDTAGELRNRHYPVVVYKEGVADFDQEAHQFALRRMDKVYGAKVV
ncbi:MAG: cysteine hydrolase family protein [Candidatus Aminicenantaceae bacterium]